MLPRYGYIYSDVNQIEWKTFKNGFTVFELPEDSPKDLILDIDNIYNKLIKLSRTYEPTLNLINIYADTITLFGKEYRIILNPHDSRNKVIFDKHKIIYNYNVRNNEKINVDYFFNKLIKHIETELESLMENINKRLILQEKNINLDNIIQLEWSNRYLIASNKKRITINYQLCYFNKHFIEEVMYCYILEFLNKHCNVNVRNEKLKEIETQLKEYNMANYLFI